MYVAFDPEMWDTGQLKADDGTEAHQSRWPTGTPFANFSKCQIDNKEMFWQGFTWQYLEQKTLGTWCSCQTQKVTQNYEKEEKRKGEDQNGKKI